MCPHWPIYRQYIKNQLAAGTSSGFHVGPGSASLCVPVLPPPPSLSWKGNWKGVRDPFYFLFSMLKFQVKFLSQKKKKKTLLPRCFFWTIHIDHLICLIVKKLIEFPFNLLLKLLTLLLRSIASLKQNTPMTEIVAGSYHPAGHVRTALEQLKAVDTDLEKVWELGT